MQTFEKIEKQQSKENPSAYKKLSNFLCKKGMHSLIRRRFKENGYEKKACKNCHQIWYRIGNWHKEY